MTPELTSRPFAFVTHVRDWHKTHQVPAEVSAARKAASDLWRVYFECGSEEAYHTAMEAETAVNRTAEKMEV